MTSLCCRYLGCDCFVSSVFVVAPIIYLSFVFGPGIVIQLFVSFLVLGKSIRIHHECEGGIEYKNLHVL